MKRIVGQVRRMIQDYDMLRPGDHVAVGLSGGKDSFTTLCALDALSRQAVLPLHITAITIDLGFPGVDLSPLQEWMARREINFVVVKTNIGPNLFSEGNEEKNPCALCAHLRRGTLHNEALRQGCKTVALGHHLDDAVETFLLSLLHEGRVHCFKPVTELDRSGITLIRPLLYVEESDIRAAVKRADLPVVYNPCPQNGCSQRSRVGELVDTLEAEIPDLRHKLFGALKRLPLPGWEEKTTRTS